MSYVDGFVLAVPRDRMDRYADLARLAGEVWKEHGALAYVQVVGDDVPHGTLTSFPRAVQAKEDGVVVLAWIVHASRAARDATNAKVAKDPRMTEANMFVDRQRMIFGGFEAFLEL